MELVPANYFVLKKTQFAERLKDSIKKINEGSDISNEVDGICNYCRNEFENARDQLNKEIMKQIDNKQATREKEVQNIINGKDEEIKAKKEAEEKVNQTRQKTKDIIVLDVITKEEIDRMMGYISQQLNEIRDEVQYGHESVENAFRLTEFLYGSNMNALLGNITSQYEKSLNMIAIQYKEKEDYLKNAYEEEKKSTMKSYENLTYVSSGNKAVVGPDCSLYYVMEDDECYSVGIVNNFVYNNSKNNKTISYNSTKKMFIYHIKNNDWIYSFNLLYNNTPVMGVFTECFRVQTDIKLFKPFFGVPFNFNENQEKTSNSNICFSGNGNSKKLIFDQFGEIKANGKLDFISPRKYASVNHGYSIYYIMETNNFYLFDCLSNYTRKIQYLKNYTTKKMYIYCIKNETTWANIMYNGKAIIRVFGRYWFNLTESGVFRQSRCSLMLNKKFFETKFNFN
ncbi:hypothetical protein PIROE2DRAFT_15581 [Piromyces sp. E2]|nr:hypothetical protein PIROE2DRAFT_15581 [Piromyces sp. E2]|eukprot:OUM59013.1 hypothetical protein PIROE2DRAFT_15581 [Piromyces sp. E2]